MTGTHRHIPPLALAALALAAGAASAEPQLSLTIGSARLDATHGDITGLQRGDHGTLHIRLAPAFDARIAALTEGRLGMTAILSVCGEPVLEATLQSPLATASFVLADPDPRRLARIESLLLSPSCPTD